MPAPAMDTLVTALLSRLPRSQAASGEGRERELGQLLEQLRAGVLRASGSVRRASAARRAPRPAAGGRRH